MQSIQPGQWILAAWRYRSGVSGDQTKELAGVIRDGCVRGRYWLRAYAALPEKLALLLYPLEDPVVLITSLTLLAGGTPGKLRIIRDDADLERTARYIESLPVRSRLAQRPEDYPWSSLGWIRASQCASVSTPQGP